jgi:hypothetical protein
MQGVAAEAGEGRRRAALWRPGLHGPGSQPDRDLAVEDLLLARAWFRDVSGDCFGMSVALLWLLAVPVELSTSVQEFALAVHGRPAGGAGSAGMPGRRSRAVLWCGGELLGVKCSVDVWQRSSQREVLLCSRASRLGGQRRRSAPRALSRRGVLPSESFAPTLESVPMMAASTDVVSLLGGIIVDSLFRLWLGLSG